MATESAGRADAWDNLWNMIFRRDQDPAAQRRRERARAARLRARDPLYWTRGRLVAIRPDGARKSLDPEKLRLIHTAEEHEQAVVAHRTFWDKVQRKARNQGKDFRPAWAPMDRE